MSESATTHNPINGTAGADVLLGTDQGDHILGMAGNDTIFGGLGDDVIDASSGNDIVTTMPDPVPGSHYGIDFVSLGDGDDIAQYIYSIDKVTIDGGNGQDRIGGGSAGDRLMGGAGDDHIAGYAGGDLMTGGSGADVFHYAHQSGDTGMTIAAADRITDFVSGTDKIDMEFAGTRLMLGHHNYGNYAEAAIDFGAGFEAAEERAAYMLWPYAPDPQNGRMYAFVTDGVNGYLFADLDHNGAADTALIFEGLTSTLQFAHTDIV
jgi:Ca2+-binding RTX toxin-like protein